MDIFRFKIFERFSADVNCAVSTRDGGVSPEPYFSLNMGFDIGDDHDHVRENYRRFWAETGANAARGVFGHQAHTDNIAVIDESYNNFGLENFRPETDAFVTNLAATPLFVRFADCQGLFLFDPVKRVVGAVHSGWKGVVQNISGKTVQKMKELYGCDPQDIIVGISPSISPEHSYFKDTRAELPEFMWKYVKHEHLVDLWACSVDQLMAEGVLQKNIEVSGICTFREKERFFSYRRAGGANGLTGRMTGFIQLAN